MEINELVSVMNNSEKVGFVQYLNKRNKRKDIRNIDLFRSILKGSQDKLKSKIGDNAYNVLKKRLTDRLLDYLSNEVIKSEVSEEIGLIKEILIARKLFVHNMFKMGFKIMLKTEEKALRINHFTILNEIYHTLIQYSYHEFSPNQIEIFERLQKNNLNFLEQEKLNMSYAFIKKELSKNDADGRATDYSLLFKKVKERFNFSLEVDLNFKTLFYITQIADNAGAYTNDYHSVNLFFENKVKELEGGPKDQAKYLIFHIDVLLLIANIYFRKRNFEKSMFYLTKMKVQMARNKNQYYQRRIIPYTTLLSLTLNYTGNQNEAAKLIDSLVDEIDFDSKDLLYLYLTRVMIFFQQKDYNSAKKIMLKFSHTDSWYEKRVGIDWLLNKCYIEILLYVELGEIGLVESRINSLVRKYKVKLLARNDTHVFPFLKLVKRYVRNPEEVKSDKFSELVEKTMNWRPVDEEDIFFMSFYAWLKSKMIAQPLYETTIELVNRKV